MADMFWFLVSLAGVYAGYRLLRTGLRKRVEPGSTVRCATCEYDLTANTSGICPECGAATAANAIRGRYTRATGLSVFAILLLGLSIHFTWGNGRQVLWGKLWTYRAPTRILLWQTHFPDAIAKPAWNSLQARVYGNMLSRDDLARLAARAAALARASSATANQRHLGIVALSQVVLAGQAQPEQIAQLQTLMPVITPTLAPRSSTTLGHEVPISVQYRTLPGERLWYYPSFMLPLRDCPDALRIILEPSIDDLLKTTHIYQALSNTITFENVQVHRQP